MTELHELNVETRKILLRKLDGASASVFQSSDAALLLIANFLREISDSSHEINDSLRQIHDDLQQIEMNTGPKL